MIDLMHTLWRGRYVIIGMVILCLILAGIYLWLARPVYETRGLYTAPALKQVIRLMPQPIPGFSLSQNDLFWHFQNQMRSNAIQEKFFDEVVWPALDGDKNSELRRLEEFDRFVEKLKIQLPGANDKENFIRMTYRGNDSKQIVEWVRGYVALANQTTLQNLKEDFEAVRNNSIENIERQIASLKFVSDQQKDQRIGLLGAALATAQTLGIEDNRIGQAIVGNVSRGGSQPAINLVEPPLYMYGTRELQAQVQSVAKSKGNYFDVGSLPDLENQLLVLRQARFQPENVLAYTERERPIRSWKPMSPKKMLVLAVAVVVGILLGICGVLIHSHLMWRRQTSATTA